jgi:hypothetical protein
MKPWFEDIPLDFTREETRTAERLLIAAYPMNQDALTLAQDAGLNLAALNQMAQVKFLVRDILIKARAANRLTTLIGEMLRDPAQEAIHDAFRALVAGHEQLIADAAMHRKPSLATLLRRSRSGLAAATLRNHSRRPASRRRSTPQRASPARPCSG